MFHCNSGAHAAWMCWTIASGSSSKPYVEIPSWTTIGATGAVVHVNQLLQKKVQGPSADCCIQPEWFPALTNNVNDNVMVPGNVMVVQNMESYVSEVLNLWTVGRVDVRPFRFPDNYLAVVV
jgi:hypothetical protein